MSRLLTLTALIPWIMIHSDFQIFLKYLKRTVLATLQLLLLWVVTWMFFLHLTVRSFFLSPKVCFSVPVSLLFQLEQFFVLLSSPPTKYFAVNSSFANITRFTCCRTFWLLSFYWKLWNTWLKKFNDCIDGSSFINLEHLETKKLNSLVSWISFESIFCFYSILFFLHTSFRSVLSENYFIELQPL